MNVALFLAMIKSEDFEYYNADRCVYIQGNSILELEKQCSSSLGYLPKYTDLVQPQQYGKEHFENFLLIYQVFCIVFSNGQVIRPSQTSCGNLGIGRKAKRA